LKVFKGAQWAVAMIDIEGQIRHWRESSREDWAAAGDMVERGHYRHGLFFAHLALEKLLKAHVCRKTSDLAPRIHNLVRLAEMAGLTLNSMQLDIFADVNRLNIQGRYPEHSDMPPTREEALSAMTEVKEVIEWLTAKL
jgi:HEPN domain-containing protein